MSAKTLFLAWQDEARSRQWYPIGRLDADVERADYRFRYTGGAERAQQEADFPLLVDFPDPQKDYQASQLFPLFKNRVIASSRPDFEDYVASLHLSKEADPIEILTVNGGYRVTDSYEVFPKLVKRADGSFVCRFFLHGWRHVKSAQKRLDQLVLGEKLHLALELTNPKTKVAVQIQTMDYWMIGWAPHYLVPDLTMALAEAPSRYEASVVRVNPPSLPLKQKFLIEMRSYWNDHEPMTSADFLPLVE